jgi:ribosomal protein L29
MVWGMGSSIEQLQLLRQSGFEQAQAEAILLVVEQKHDGLAKKEDIKEFATKTDIKELRAATKQDITELRTATKQDITELRFSTQAQIAEAKVDLIKWIVGDGYFHGRIGAGRRLFFALPFQAMIGVEDLRDLEKAIVENAGKPLIPLEKVRADLDRD